MLPREAMERVQERVMSEGDMNALYMGLLGDAGRYHFAKTIPSTAAHWLRHRSDPGGLPTPEELRDILRAFVRGRLAATPLSIEDAAQVPAPPLGLLRLRAGGPARGSLR